MHWLGSKGLGGRCVGIEHAEPGTWRRCITDPPRSKNYYIVTYSISKRLVASKRPQRATVH